MVNPSKVIRINEIPTTQNRQNLMCHTITDYNYIKIGVTHNAGSPDIASIFIGEKEIDLIELEAIVEFLKTGKA